MPVKLILLPEAEEDLIRACDWYESRKTGLSDDLLLDLDAFIEDVSHSPEMYPQVFTTFRRGNLTHFPFSVFYEYNENTVYINSIFHTSQNPDNWKSRLSNESSIP